MKYGRRIPKAFQNHRSYLLKKKNLLQIYHLFRTVPHFSKKRRVRNNVYYITKFDIFIDLYKWILEPLHVIQYLLVTLILNGLETVENPVSPSVEGNGSPSGNATENFSKNVATKRNTIFLANISPTHARLPGNITQCSSK